MRKINKSKINGRAWATLQSMIDGEVVLPGSSLYERTYKPFNARFHHIQPRAIILCATPQDVSETISFLKRHSLESAIRSGGHSFARHSSTSGVMINVTRMDSVSVSYAWAHIGAAARLGDGD